MTRRTGRRTPNLTLQAPRLLALREVMAITGLARSTIYKLKAQGRFPVPLRVTDHAVRWILREILEFIASCPRAGSDRSPKD